MPKVSLVIPCYNVERYVRQCVESALSQTLSDIELVCVNDGSTDSTLSILQGLAADDERVRIVDKANSGYGSSMNCGFDAATGEYIGILESDDFMEPQTLEVLYGLASEHGADVVKANFYFYWSRPLERNEHCDLIDEEDCGHLFNPRDEPHIFYVKPSIWSGIYKADFIRENGIRFNETPGASYQDASFNFQVWLCARRVWLMRDAFVHYRQDNEASSVNSPGKVYCVCDEYERMQGFVDALPDEADRAAMQGILVKMKYDSYMWNFERLSPELAHEFQGRFAEEMRGHIERGEIRWPLFDPYKSRDLGILLEDPEFFYLLKADEQEEPNKLRTLRRYWKAGGARYVGKLAKYRLGMGVPYE